jgi:hypothetical protein
VVVEGPNRTKELQLFFDEDVEGQWLARVQASKGMAQCVGVAVRTDEGKFEDPPFEQFDTSGMEVFGGFLADADDDGIDEQYGFERRPLYVEINPTGGQSFHVLGLHLKSNGIFGAYEWSKWWQIAKTGSRALGVFWVHGAGWTPAIGNHPAQPAPHDSTPRVAPTAASVSASSRLPRSSAVVSLSGSPCSLRSAPKVAPTAVP